MAFQPLSVGDILMLSQTAWKIGRAFTHGKKSAPTEFARIEDEANNLANVLKLAAETLHADDSILARAAPQTTEAVWAIMASAERSLNDLDSFVESYQIVKKRGTSGGYLVERSWSDAVLSNYKKLKWTTEGGNITHLQEMLHMHTNTITLTMQALQTRSLSRLERTVTPMAENVASIHEQVTGDLGSKIDDVHRVIMAVANSTPSLRASDGTRLIVDRQRQLSESSTHSTPLLLESPTQDEVTDTGMETFIAHRRCDSAIATPSSPLLNRQRYPSRRLSSAHPAEYIIGGSAEYEALALAHASPRASNEPQALVPAENESASMGKDLYANSRTSSIAESPTSTHRASDAATVGFGPFTASQHDFSCSTGSSAQRIDPTTMKLPSPALKPRQPPAPRIATPSSLLTSSTDAKKFATPAKQDSDRLSDSAQAKAAFERSLFRNAAILCDTRGALVEYAHHNADSADPRYDTEMRMLCKEARICVIRKRENGEHGGTRLATAIWVLTDDQSLRCQQKLSDHAETIPYSSFFEAKKISIAGSTNDDLSLRCHDLDRRDVCEKEVKTSWVNYFFSSDLEAKAFQSAVFGRTLVGSFRTSKTTVIHEGIKGVFAFEEQFAKIDRLRLWEDDGVATAGGEGGVLALLHVSSTFGTGWARWWINSSRQQIHIKKEGDRCVKIKGLGLNVPGSIPVTHGPARRASIVDEHLVRVNTATPPVRSVSGLRVEFETIRERDEFMALIRRVRERMLLLPYL